MTFLGQSGSQRLAGDLGICRRPRCDEGSSHQRRAGDTGARGQSLPKTGEGEPDGRVEVLHLLWVSGVPLVESVEVGFKKIVFCGWKTGGKKSKDLLHTAFNTKKLRIHVHKNQVFTSGILTEFTLHQTLLNVISISINFYGSSSVNLSGVILSKVCDVTFLHETEFKE